MTLRGFHYQKHPYGEDKTITCIKGEIFNVTIDLRKNSKTFKKWKGFYLNEKIDTLSTFREDVQMHFNFKK